MSFFRQLQPPVSLTNNIPPDPTNEDSLRFLYVNLM